LLPDERGRAPGDRRREPVRSDREGRVDHGLIPRHRPRHRQAVRPARSARGDLEPQLQTLVDRTLAELGGIDILVCNAAVNPYFGPLAKIPDDAYDKIMNANVRSNLWLCNMALPHMAARGGGAAIIVSSIAGIKGTRMLGAYGLSKAADSALARNLAVEWGSKNVRVNALAPGVIKTDFAKALYENPETEKYITKQYPIGRLGVTDDVAGVAVMLASRAGSFITGQTIVIDGGTTIGGFE